VESHRRQPEYAFDLSGGDLSLDFANTVSRRTVQERRTDHLTTYDDLVAFARQSKALSLGEAEQHLSYAHQHQQRAKAALREALEFREVLYRAFSALAAGSQAPPSDLREINNRAIQAMTHRKLVREDGRYRWHWRWNKAWLFLDRSRNRSRRWCDMKTCGNREKARRHYQREHA